jgi:hypothetical protein
MPQEERTCPSCGILYSAPSKWWDEQRKTGGVFYCPNGHARHFIKGKSEADKLREELSRERQRLAEYNDALRSEREKREAAERREAAQKANVTKLKKRAGAGVCPCCNRTVQQLANHMANKHLEFVENTGAKVIPMKRKAS